MNFSYVWPIALVVLSNTVYQICAKGISPNINPLAALTVTYLVAAITCGILYFALNRDANLIREYSRINWASIVLGVILVGLEVGMTYAYKNGWQVSTAATVQSAFLAVALLVVGFLIYHEVITWSKVAGVALCLAGLALLNR